MEFSNRLHKLRKDRGLTQEELAEILHVSRAAVSKWESGRGFPNIASLKDIGRVFGVTVDSLLSADEVTDLAHSEQRSTTDGFVRFSFTLIDLCAVMFYFLPVFGEETAAGITSCPLFILSALPEYVKYIYIICISLCVSCGLISALLIRHTAKAYLYFSYAFHIACAGVFIITRQVYASMLSLVLLSIKCILQIKHK